MTPKQIAKKVIDAAITRTKHPGLLQDELAKEIAHAIAEERELISRYLQFLNESIAFRPELVRHRLLLGSTRISTGQFLEDMSTEEHSSYRSRINSAHSRYYPV